MKRFIFLISIFAMVSAALAADRFEVASLAGFDSSFGKEPVIPESTVVTLPSNVGKQPFVMSVDGPPPYSKGPGLRFNTKEWFYIYTDHGAAPNHFVPSGWMGDFDDLTLDMDSHENPADGKTCIKITYSAKQSDNTGWAGMYWQQPVNNWGNKAGGFNLKGMKQLTFWARGEKGGEVISQFKVGGISGDHPDSDAISIGPVVLTTDWKKYFIDLTTANLSQISGGFAWAASSDDNPQGITFFLDEIRFER